MMYLLLCVLLRRPSKLNWVGSSEDMQPVSNYKVCFCVCVFHLYGGNVISIESMPRKKEYLVKIQVLSDVN